MTPIKTKPKAQPNTNQNINLISLKKDINLVPVTTNVQKPVQLWPFNFDSGIALCTLVGEISSLVFS